MFCMKCGRKLEDGEVCNCEQQNANASQAEETKQEEVKQENVNSNKNSNNFFKNLGNLFVRPADAIKDAVQNNRWINGIIYVVIVCIVSSIFSTIFSVASTIGYYNDNISYVRESYQNAVRKYGEDSFSARMYLERIESAKKVRNEAIFNFEFILKTIGNFLKKIVTPIIGVLFITLVLFAFGKLFKGQCTFGTLLAGVGLAYNIQYLQIIITQIFARIPYVNVLVTLVSLVTMAYGILVFFAFWESSKLDENKSAVVVFISFFTTLFISSLFTVVIQVAKNIIAEF